MSRSAATAENRPSASAGDEARAVHGGGGLVRPVRADSVSAAVASRRGQAFTTFLSGFDTVYHANVQLDLTLNGDTASSISYCLVTLIGPENGKRMKTSMLVIYNDSYVRSGVKC